LTVVFYAIGCSATKEPEIQKNYQLYLESQDPTAQTKLRDLIARFNTVAGFIALNYTDSDEGDVSRVHLATILDDGAAAGQGGGREKFQYEEQANRGDYLPVRMKTMELWFTFEAFFEYPVEENWLVFCHEIGHGLEMMHSANPKSIMYSGNYETKTAEWDIFFDRVRAYFSDDFQDWATYEQSHPGV